MSAVQIRSRIKTTSSWTEQAANADPAAGTFTFMADAPNTDVEIQLRTRMVSGVFSPWQAIEIHTASVPATTGPQGPQGVPGPAGANGQTSYVHYAYANSPDGTIDFTTDAPGSRAYEGSYTDFAATDSNSPSAYTWRPYRGPPFGMAARGSAVVSGDQVIKSQSGASAWDSDAYSTVGWAGACQVSFQAGQQTAHIMAGLNSDPATNASYLSIDYCWYMTGQGALQVFESANEIGEYGGYDQNTILAIVYDGRSVRYIKDGTVVRTSTASAGQTFYFDSSFNTPGGRLVNVAFAAAGRAGAVSDVPAPPCGGERRLRVHADGRRCAAWSYAGVKAPDWLGADPTV